MAAANIGPCVVKAQVPAGKRGKAGGIKLAAGPDEAKEAARQIFGMKGEIQFSLGYCKPGPSARFGHPTSFGHPGAGGSFAFADPETGTGYAYVTNRMGTRLPFDPRDVALRTAIP